MPDISRALLDALLPPGVLWVPKEDGDFDLLLDGMADNYESVLTFLTTLAYLRDAQKTTILSDLEKEYGILPNSDLSEQTRRDRLQSTIVAANSDGSANFMQERLQEAGFDILVHINSPPVDPNIFIDIPQIFCKSSNAYCGNQNAVCGGVAGGLIVNGDIFTQRTAFGTVCGGNISFSGNSAALCGGFADFTETPVSYSIPSDPGYWGLIFFIGGPAVRDSITDELISIETVLLPVSRQEELTRLIVKYKPLHSWCGLIAGFI